MVYSESIHKQLKFVGIFYLRYAKLTMFFSFQISVNCSVMFKKNELIEIGTGSLYVALNEMKN